MAPYVKAILPLWLPDYAQSFGDLPPEISQAPLRLSAAAIDRFLNPVRTHY